MRLLGLFIATAIGIAGLPAFADNYPSKTITIVVPFPPGAITDIVGRIVADHIQSESGQTVVVENRPGAAGNLGVNAVARSKPDGYTLAVIANSIVAINPHLYKSMPFDPLTDLTPIGPVGDVPGVVVVNKEVPARDLREFIALAKAKPGLYNYGSSGVGSPLHLTVYRWASSAGIELTHVPYRGAAQAVTDLLGGRIHLMQLGFGVVSSHVNAGTLRALAIDARQRLPALSDVGTMAEFGLAEDGASTWFGIAAPAGTPDEVADRLSGYLRTLTTSPSAKKRLADAFIETGFTSRAQFAARIKSDSALWGKIVKEAGLEPQ